MERPEEGRADREYFAYHQAQVSARAASIPQERPAGTLETLIARVRGIRDSLGEDIHRMASVLEAHADAVHGPLPKTDGADTVKETTPVFGSGLVAELQGAVWELESALYYAVARAGAAADRNVTLA